MDMDQTQHDRPAVSSGWQRFLRGAGAVSPIYYVLAALMVAIVLLNPNFLQPIFFMNFLKKAAPLVILACGQLFVVVSGGFDLSVGSLITFTVLAGALLTGGDPAATWWAIPVLYGIGLAVGLFNGLVVSFLRVPSIIVTLGMLITLKGAALLWSGGSARGYLPDNFRLFGRNMITDLPLIQVIPYALLVAVAVGAVAIWLLHRSNYGKAVLAVGDNPGAAAMAGTRVPLVRTLAFVFSALSAVTAGILLGGFSGVSTDVGDGFELQAISAVVLGGAQLLGGRGSMPAAMAGAVTLSALFTLLNLLGLPKPLRDAVQGLILIGAVAYAVHRKRRRV